VDVNSAADAAGVLRSLVASIERSPIASVIADARQPDMPIVAVNAAFCELTGYPSAETVGRNCRFLAGARTETPRRQALREALAAARPVLTELINYRKDGSMFCNAVMIAPVMGPAGEPLFFLGSQMEVAPHGATALARRQEAEAALHALTPRQRQVLRLMTEGLRNKQIAAELAIDEATVKLHRSLLLRRLGGRSSGEAVRLAVEAGLHLDRAGRGEAG
jgi:PAS domain S-box-containing protein